MSFALLLRPALRLVPRARSASTFAQLGLRPELVAAVEAMGISEPTEVQAAAIPPALRGGNILSSAPTGTGKTLCMLLPLLHRVKDDETVRRIAARPMRPRAVVLSPTRELAAQTLSVAKRLSHHCRVRVVGALGGSKRRAQAAALRDPLGVDVLVGTPGRLLQLQESGALSLGDARYVLLDEADSMMADDTGAAVRASAGATPSHRRADAPEDGEDGSFSGETGRLLRGVLSAVRAGDATSGAGDWDAGPAGAAGFDPTAAVERHVQFLLAAATLSPAAERAVTRRIPGGVDVVRASGTHSCPPALRATFERVGRSASAVHEDRMVALEAAVRRASKRAPGGGVVHRTLVFCGSIASARAVAATLEGAGWPVASLHGGLPPQLRAQEFARAMSGSRPVLVATDAAARGLDLPGADDVIMFDFPRTGEDFLHRAGRTARAGRAGRVLCLVGQREVDQAARAEAAMRSGAPLLEAWGGTTRRGAGGGAQASSTGKRGGEGGGQRPRRATPAAPGPGGATEASQKQRQGGSDGRGPAPKRKAGDGAARGRRSAGSKPRPERDTDAWTARPVRWDRPFVVRK